MLEDNPWFTFIYKTATQKRDAESIYRAMVNFSYYPLWIEQERYVDNTNDPDVQNDPLHPEFSIDPLAIYKRHSSNYVWHRCHYKLVGGQDIPR